MKFLSRIAPILAACSLAAAPALAADTTEPGPDDPSLLYIEIVDSVMPRSHDGWTGDRMENERYHTLVASLEAAFKELDLPNGFKVVRFNTRIPEEAPHLQVVAMRWQLDNLMPQSGDFLCDLAGELKLPDGETIDLGKVTGKVSNFQAMTRSGGPNYSDYQKVSDVAAAMMAQRFTERLSPDGRGAQPPKVEE